MFLRCIERSTTYWINHYDNLFRRQNTPSSVNLSKIKDEVNCIILGLTYSEMFLIYK